MKQKSILLRFLLLMTIVLLMVGCSKKPVSDGRVIDRNTQTVQEEVIAQQPVGIDGDSISEAEAAAEALRAAQEAASQGLQRIYFEFDQYVLTDQAKQILQANASLLADKAAVTVLIEGHSDERGSDEYNLALGEKRALAARSYLVSLGLPADQLQVLSYGEELPLDPSDSESAWAQNRRAEFKVKR